MAAINFDAKNTKPATGIGAVPKGAYICAAEATQMKRTKKGDGEYLEITYVITEGEYAGRKLWARLNLSNPNAQAVEIAEGQLAAICNAVGIELLTDTDDLIDRPILLRVSNKTDTEGKERNEITDFRPVPTAPTRAPEAPRPTAVAGSAPAWKKGK